MLVRWSLLQLIFDLAALWWWRSPISRSFHSRTLPSSPSDDVRDLESLLACFVRRRVWAPAQPTLWRALVLIVRVDCPTSPAGGLFGSRANVGTMAELAARVADIDLFAKEKALHKDWAIAYKVRNLESVESYDDCACVLNSLDRQGQRVSLVDDVAFEVRLTVVQVDVSDYSFTRCVGSGLVCTDFKHSSSHMKCPDSCVF